ncbi:MAG TPA: hypothetical protein VFH54_02150 [Mycobacteriales bacterium]|nr:hypothetical protein [Mycobacteriales bacterium]
MRITGRRIAPTIVATLVVTTAFGGVAAAAGPTAPHGFCRVTPSLTSCAGNVGGAICPPNGDVVVLNTPWSLLDTCSLPQP